MCSIIFTSKNIENLDEVNRVTKFRGPDLTTTKTIDGYTYVHNLLSITGAMTPQPFEKDGVVAIYNGEIYNHSKFGEFKSDGECIIEAYKQYGEKFAKELDGEFAIVLVDYNKNIFLISSDTFKTKPIYYSISGTDVGVASYSEPLKLLGFNDVRKFTPNTTFVFDLSTKNAIDRFQNVEFDVTHQHKQNLDDWTTAYEEAIRKRTEGIREKVFIGLSSGYDSGAICCEFMKQNVDFKTYTLRGTENETILQQRIKLLQERNIKHTILSKSDPELMDTIAYIKRNTEDFKYTICSSSSPYNEFDLSLTDDGGSRHLSYICKKASDDGYKILMSGMGPDEIYSDYGFGGYKVYGHSNFGGLFPNNLESIFPWNSFYGSTMESYIAKEEFVGGSYGIEIRYPFLDKKVVQEFLWLDVSIKNRSYKHPLDYYLQINNYPYNRGEKLGF